jgi:hypothetical protein
VNYTSPISQHDRQYTLGGDGYGDNGLHGDTPAYNVGYGYAGVNHSPAPIDTNVVASSSPVVGPRSLRSAQQTYDDGPPGYDQGPSAHYAPGGWGSKS